MGKPRAERWADKGLDFFLRHAPPPAASKSTPR